MAISIVVILLLVEILLVGGDAIARYLFDSPLLGADELAAALFVILAYLGLADAERHNMHVAVTGLCDRLPQKAQGPLRTYRLIVNFIYVGIVSYLVGRMVTNAFGSRITGTLMLPQFPVQIWMVVGLILLLLVLVTQFIKKRQTWKMQL